MKLFAFLFPWRLNPQSELTFSEKKIESCWQVLRLDIFGRNYDGGNLTLGDSRYGEATGRPHLAITCEGNECGSDPRSYEHYLSRSENKG